MAEPVTPNTMANSDSVPKSAIVLEDDQLDHSFTKLYGFSFQDTNRHPLRFYKGKNFGQFRLDGL